MVRFADITTVAIGGEITSLFECHTESELLDTVQRLSASGEEFLLVGGGSNILPQDGAEQRPVVLIVPAGNEFEEGGFIFAGETLDDVAKKLNLAALSGIPGSLGGAIVQNAGAYGAQIADYVQVVKVYDAVSEEVHEYSAEECAFKYRSSRFKGNSLREIVLSVKLKPAGKSQSAHHPQLAKALQVDLRSKASADEIRAKVLEIRDQKGMLSPRFEYGNATDSDRFSTGSFFTNPSLPAQKFYDILEICKLKDDEVPHWSSNAGIKISAAWLIDQAGISKGFSLKGHDAAKVSSKHTLALVNVRPNAQHHDDRHQDAPQAASTGQVPSTRATTDEGASGERSYATPGADMRALSQHIDHTVFEKFGVHLSPEVIIL